ncbi:MAG: SCP2 sterol-binding domain-containing protein [Chloroflexi bacterium]|nr:SCP2 sterol-binding domain-containing protein [Anaerolineaceae bacterium]NMB90600.1 SCP2 sterol-binding domain-containing protein [Chloroflexota bacterium]
MSNPGIEDLIKLLPQTFVPERAAGVDADIQLHVSGENGGDWFVAIHQQTIKVEPGTTPNPQLTFSASAQDILDVFSGKLDATRAFMSGRLHLKGNLGQAMRLANLFSMDRAQL